MVEKLNLVSVINLERQFLIVFSKNVSCITLFTMSICLKNKTKKSIYKSTLFNFIEKDRLLVERIGIEPMTFCLQSRCSPS